ncbi:MULTISPECIES: hypothetical protein [Pseudomonas]|uniref:Uncharacterized protein n=1 Tax=Pseudomonas aphyarum TaxID=2942629 RepID=A0ABT5PQT9_9PSED|nr:hypothetical protein [Pseudomonas aphyarum]MDD0971197.1 hypothetical protein [Pseudomonas aphyarum]MDD1125837.1 hypothetical protein [Pseudomonas aphyarum]
MNMQVKAGGGVLALPPTVVGLVSGDRLTYQQLKVDRKVTFQLADVDDKTPSGAHRIQLLVYPKGYTPVEFDPTYVVMELLKANQTGGNWTFPVDFDLTGAAIAALVDKFDAAGAYNEFGAAFIIYDEFDNADTSQPTLVFFADLTGPWQRQPGTGNGTGNRPPLINQAGLPTLIDDNWLNNNAGGLNITISTAWVNFEAGIDLVNFFISQLTTFTGMQGEGAIVADFPVPANGVINIPLTALQALKDGAYYYSYNLEDDPGNISNNSAITLLFNRVSAPAPVLGIPRIPVTGTNGQTPITFASFRPDPNAVVMEIDFPLNSLQGHKILPHIMDETGIVYDLPEQSIPAPGTSGPLKFVLDYAFLAPVFGDPNRDTDHVVEYWFEYIDPTKPVNLVSTPQQFATIDFAYAGSEQPNLPDLENPNIDPVEVQGGGTPVPAPNTLGPNQAGLDATMIWNLWTDPLRPITGREIVTFFYQGKQVGTPVGVQAGATTVTTRLPWTTILAEGNGTGATAREAYIVVSYPGSANPMTQTPVTPVNVTAIVINLPAPKIVVSAFRTPTGAVVPERFVTSVNCPSLDHPAVANGPMPPYEATRRLRIRVERDANIPTGATVAFKFEGRTTNGAGGTVIGGTLVTASKPMPATGPLEFDVPYANVRPIQLPSPGPGQRPATQYAYIEYVVNGITASVIVAVALLNSSLVYCEQNRP